MKFIQFTPEMKDSLQQHADTNGDISRDHFIDNLFCIIGNAYVLKVNEENELSLRSSIKLGSIDDIELIRYQLFLLFDCLDIQNKHSVPLVQIISLLCLLSRGDMKDRLTVVFSFLFTFIFLKSHSYCNYKTNFIDDGHRELLDRQQRRLPTPTRYGHFRTHSLYGFLNPRSCNIHESRIYHYIK